MPTMLIQQDAKETEQDLDVEAGNSREKQQPGATVDGKKNIARGTAAFVGILLLFGAAVVATGESRRQEGAATSKSAYSSDKGTRPSLVPIQVTEPSSARSDKTKFANTSMPGFDHD